MITQQQILQIIPSAREIDVAKYIQWIETYFDKYTINTPARMAGWLAQVAQESNSFRSVLEYASGEEYENRLDLGNNQPGDGIRFKGRGLIQITGRGNYRWASKDMYGDSRLLDNPSLLEQPSGAVESACWYWAKDKNLNLIADNPEQWTHLWPHTGKTYSKIAWMTILVNGGLNGLSTREANYSRARTVLGF